MCYSYVKIALGSLGSRSVFLPLQLSGQQPFTPGIAGRTRVRIFTDERLLLQKRSRVRPSETHLARVCPPGIQTKRVGQRTAVHGIPTPSKYTAVQRGGGGKCDLSEVFLLSGKL